MESEEQQQPYDVYAQSRPVDQPKTESLKPVNTTPQPNLPDFLIYSRDYLKAHPDAIQYVLGDTLTDLHSWLNDLPMGLGNILKAQIPPEYSWLIAPANNNGNTPALRAGRRSPRNDDDDTEEADYIPDTDILKEAISEAVTMHLADIPWADISNHLYRKYEIDWHFMKVKDVVLKNLAWGQRRPQKISPAIQPAQIQSKPEVVQPEKIGLIRWLFRKLY